MIDGEKENIQVHGTYSKSSARTTLLKNNHRLERERLAADALPGHRQRDSSEEEESSEEDEDADDVDGMRRLMW